VDAPPAARPAESYNLMAMSFVYFRTHNAAERFLQTDRYAVDRLRGLMVKRYVVTCDPAGCRGCASGLRPVALTHARHRSPPGIRVVTIRKIIRKPRGGRSSRQGCGPAVVSPATSVFGVEREATPHIGLGNRPGDAWCEGSAAPARAAVGAFWGLMCRSPKVIE
jgi:hypothetical protein